MATVTTRRRASGIEPLDRPTDTAAVTELYERNARRVFGYCLSRLGRREDAEDAVQTTFLHAIRGLRRGVVPLVESAWLLGIARNVCLTRREALGRRKQLEASCDPHDLEEAAPVQSVARDELVGLSEALAQLPERQRRAVLLRDWRGLSYDEVAADLEVSRAAVETLIFRGRATLAALLDEEPRATRKRLAGLGNIGSFFAAVKSAFTGGAAAVKVAAAVTAVSTAGLAVGSVDGTFLGGSGGDAARRAAAAAPAGASAAGASSTKTATTSAATAPLTADTAAPAATTRAAARPAAGGHAGPAHPRLGGAAAAPATETATASATAPAASASEAPRADGTAGAAVDTVQTAAEKGGEVGTATKKVGEVGKTAVAEVVKAAPEVSVPVPPAPPVAQDPAVPPLAPPVPPLPPVPPVIVPPAPPAPPVAIAPPTVTPPVTPPTPPVAPPETPPLPPVLP